MAMKLRNIYREKSENDLRKIAIDDVDSGAMMELAFRCMEMGRKDAGARKEAVEWFNMAACNGEILAARMLVECYEEGYGFGKMPHLADSWSDDLRKFTRGKSEEELMEFCPASFMMEMVDVQEYLG